jgi:hypothetical protein
MEPLTIKTPVQSRSEGKNLLPCQRERKRRFQIVKLEERIAPDKGGLPHMTNNGHGCGV